MTPSLFSNNHSRGPLYQYWKERSDEESSLRQNRIADARLRSRGQRPMSPTPGPSSAVSYADRASRGPPTYQRCTGIGPASEETGETTTTSNTLAGRNVHSPTETDAGSDTLPPYYAVATRGEGTPPVNTSGSRMQNQVSNTTTLPSATEEEKPRLSRNERHHHHHHHIASDETPAQASTMTTTGTTIPFDDDQGNDHQPKRRKSVVGKVGGWLADAASGYTKKQERW
ncbi:hypothetical protein H2204_002147 [Knufia peltigerae]|uniref:Uncharacterized protein n=1 Tax=Knufia peltigerae TaxID=1002370 RepID=A0AA38YDA9_9EURO|nr:hypothetical protein H2204_002147 [Knufia peltigerae]